MARLRRAQPWASTTTILLLVVSVNISSDLNSSRAAPYGSQPDNCDFWVDQCFQYSFSSAHFAVFYNTTGRFSVTFEWARNVSIMAEAAYKELVTKDGFTPPARNPIPIYLDRANGGFTSVLLCELCPITPTSLQHLQIEFRYKSPCPNYCGIPTSNWEVAHEVFHTIQYTEFNGTLPFGHWLAEGSANWAGYRVAGNESRWDPWEISAWLGPDGTTEMSLDQRTYDNAFFLVFLSDHYGGPEIIKRIMSDANRTAKASDVIVSQLIGLGYKKTFAGVLNEFATAILTGNFTDRDGKSAVLRESPRVAATAEWTGMNQSVATFTSGVNGFRAGDPLQVGVTDGFEYVRIEPASGATLAVNIEGPNRSCFEATVIPRLANSSSSASYRIASGPVTVVSPDRYESIFVAVTRSSCSSGEFSIGLGGVSSQPEGPQALVPPLALLSALAILLVLVAAGAAVILGRRRVPSERASESRSPKIFFEQAIYTRQRPKKKVAVARKVREAVRRRTQTLPHPTFANPRCRAARR